MTTRRSIDGDRWLRRSIAIRVLLSPSIQVDGTWGSKELGDVSGEPRRRGGRRAGRLATAVHLLVRGVEPLVLEAGGQAGAAIREWGHIRLFSRGPSSSTGPPPICSRRPAGRHPTPSPTRPGGSGPTRYLQPLADALGDRVRYRTRVTGIARYGWDLLVTDGRDREPLFVHVRSDDGPEHRLAARAVVDASGTWTRARTRSAPTDYPPSARPTPTVAPRLNYRVPDLDDPAVTARYAGRHIALAGSGHSALTALAALAAPRRTRRQPPRHPDHLTASPGHRRRRAGGLGGGTADQLPARGALGLRARAAVESGVIDVRRGFRTAAVDVMDTGTLRLTAEDGSALDDLDEVIALTGFRLDLTGCPRCGSTSTRPPGPPQAGAR